MIRRMRVKKVSGILFCLLTLCVSLGVFVCVNRVTYAYGSNVTVSSELFIPSEISIEPLSYDSEMTYFDGAIKLVSDNKNESIRLKNKLSGEFTMEYMPEKKNNVFTAEKFTIVFTDVQTQKSFSLNLEHGDTTNVYVQANNEKVGAYYLTGAFKGLTTLCNYAGSYTEIVAKKIAIKFEPETMSLYAGAAGEKLLLVWSLTEEVIDGRNFGQIFAPFNEYYVDFSITETFSAKTAGEVLIYDINGCKLNNIIVDGVGNTSIFADFDKNAIVNRFYQLPAVLVSDVVNGVKNNAQVNVTVVDGKGNNVNVNNGRFLPASTGDYTVNYEYNGVAKKYVVHVFGSQPVYDYEVFWNLADNYPVNSEIIIPEMILSGGLLRYGNVKADVCILKNGNVLSGYDKVESGSSFVFGERGEYLFRYDIGAGAFVEYGVSVTEQRVLFITEGLENYYEKGAYIDASDYKVLDSGREVDYEFSIQYPDGKKYSNKKFALTEVGNYVLSARYNDGQNLYNLTKKVVVNSKTQDFFSYTSSGVKVSHGRSLMTGRSGVKIHFEEADQLIKYNLPVDISQHKNIGQKNSYNVTKVSSAAKPIIELTIDPQKRGTNAASGINIYLMDAADPDNVVTVNVLNKSSSVWSYMRAAAPKQSLVGFYNDGSSTAFNYDNTTGSITGDGTMFYHAFKGGIVDDFTAKDSRIALYYDNETKQIFTHNARLAKTDIVVDLDDGKFTTAPWSGFKSDTVYVSFSLAYVSSTGADVTVYSVDGRSFENENVSYSTDPQISIDENVVLTGIKGRDFVIPEAAAYDCLGKRINNVITKVYYDYSGKLIDVSAADGKFRTDKTGSYRIEYTAKDVFGNVSVKNVTVETVNSYASIGISVDKSWGADRQVTTDIQICPTSQVAVTNAVGVTEITRAVYLLEGDKMTPVEVSDDNLRTTKPGRYYVEFTVVDGTLRIKTGGYFISVFAESDYAVIGALPNFVGFVRGNSYEIPQVLLMDYSDGNAQEKYADIYVNGELFNETVLTVERGEAEGKDATEKEEYITVEYKCGEKTVKSYIVPVKTVYKADVKKLPGGLEVPYTRFMQDRFFISENGADHRINSSGIILSSVSDNGKISFVQPLASEKLSLVFDVNFEKTFEKDEDGNLIFRNTNVKTFIITLTDAYDVGKVLAIKISTNDNTGYAYLYTGDVISQDISASLVGVSAEQFSLRYDNASGKIIDAVTGTQVLSPRTYENGTPFDGFSELVYVSFSFTCKEENAAADIFLYSINGQSFSSSVNKDQGEPSITVNGKLDGVFSVGESITVPSAKAADVFGSVIGNGKFNVSVILTKGGQSSYVKDVNGLLLKEVSPYTAYEIKFNELGEYRIVYFAKDSNDVEKETTFTVTVVHDNKPEFKFDGELVKQAKLNDTVSIPTATVDFFEKGNNEQLYVYVISPTYDIELVKEYEFVVKETGVYTVRYFVLDVYGNYELVDFKIQVRK